jgi:hypothetical protein
VSTIVKTGVVLLKCNEPYPFWLTSQYLTGDGEPGPPVSTIYGDLHVVGNCCILYYPATQVMWGASHGWIDLKDPHQRLFQKDTTPFKVLVVPASRITIRRDALHPIDLSKFVGAGGLINDSRGEMG